MGKVNEIRLASYKKATKCGYCGKKINRGEGHFKIGMTSKKSFFICNDCFMK